MILRQQKRKRKQSLDDSNEKNTSDSNDKYVAYVIKSKKKKSKEEDKQSSKIKNVSVMKTKKKRKLDIENKNKDFEEPAPSNIETIATKIKKKNKKNNAYSISEASTSKIENLLMKKKKKRETKNEDLNIAPVTDKPVVIKTNVEIWAKPVINKNAIQLVEAVDLNNKVDFLKTKKHIKNSKKQKEKIIGKREVRGDVELITPVVSLTKGMKINNPKAKPLPPVTGTPSSLYDKMLNSSCMVIEANLTKPSSSYLPEILRDDNDYEDDDEITHPYNIKNKLRTNNVAEKKDEAVQVSFEYPSVTEQTNNTEPNSNCNVPKALQEFYEEVTKAFDVTTDKSSKINKCHIKKKAALSVDNLIKDSNSLKKIVQNSSSILNNLPVNEDNIGRFFSLENKVILILKPKTLFSFLGKLKIKVLYGAIELYGSVFEPQNTIKQIEVYSPRGYSPISISTYNLDHTYNKEALWDALILEGVDRSLKTKLHDAIQECETGWSVLMLENFENTLTNFLNSHCPFKLFPRIKNEKYSWCDSRRAECVLQANFQFFISGHEISISPQWNECIIKELLEQWNNKKSLCTMLTGGKGVGKSTTVRYLINNLLKISKKVILLDLDPGQAEMTPAACVSLNIIDEPLLGPNFTHLKTPFYQFCIQDINVSNCLTHYIECAKKLVDCLKSKKELAEYPVIVNTMGFCKGIGFDICMFLIKLIQPTNIIQLTSKRPRSNFEFALEKEIINQRKNLSLALDFDKSVFERTCDYKLHCIPSVAEGKRQFDTWSMEPRQQRELVLLSYLSQIIQNADEKSFCNFISNKINNVIPYTLPFSSFYVSLRNLSISQTHILSAMNGNVVALCGIDLNDDSSSTNRDPLIYPKIVIKPPPSTCYGYGIVQGIDMKQHCIYVNTPLVESQLCHVNLIEGCFKLPISLRQAAST